MTLYARVEEVAVRDFEMLRLISKDNLHYLVSKVEQRVLDTEGIDSKEGYIYQIMLEEVAHVFVKGLILDKA
tara:strand:+ start:409 stop:624 length:216 start_codon:yes stop_codon:yes gene_type:complete